MSIQERPIIFSAEMVRAILDSRKTQTRRVVKPQLTKDQERCYWNGRHFEVPSREPWIQHPPDCPYGQPGDRLWVRETWFELYDPNTLKPTGRCAYAATNTEEVVQFNERGCIAENKDGTMRSPWKSSIHMPRWASRILLEIIEVRVERMLEITWEDCRAEGIIPALLTERGHGISKTTKQSYRMGFESLWNSLHGPDAWEKNSWVWVISFQRGQLCG